MPRILHLGIGSFHRAHQAAYTEMANAVDSDSWEIVGVSLRSPRIRDLLKSQDCAYTLAISDDTGTRFARINCVRDVLFAPEEQQEVLAQISDPETRIISLTVTEKGYHLDPATGRLNLDAPPVQADLKGSAQTIYGLLAKGFRRRRDYGAGPVTVLSCDNLNGNGSKLRTALSDFLDVVDSDLAAHVDDMHAFPKCMVDRITPATTDALIAEVIEKTSIPDCAPVATEAYSEWVIEDVFPSGRPDWERAGVVFTDNVAPFELRKLRLLNGAHSGLAYSGLLAGHRFVHEAIADPNLRALAKGIMSEAAETLPTEIRDTGGDYARALIERFGNPHLNHELRQIAMDGSLKLPIRQVATWQDRTTKQMSSPYIEAALAAWVGFAMSDTSAGRALQDPAGTEIADLCRNSGSNKEAISALLELIGILPSKAEQSGLTARISKHLT